MLASQYISQVGITPERFNQIQEYLFIHPIIKIHEDISTTFQKEINDLIQFEKETLESNLNQMKDYKNKLLRLNSIVKESIKIKKTNLYSNILILNCYGYILSELPYDFYERLNPNEIGIEEKIKLLSLHYFLIVKHECPSKIVSNVLNSNAISLENKVKSVGYIYKALGHFKRMQSQFDDSYKPPELNEQLISSLTIFIKFLYDYGNKEIKIHEITKSVMYIYKVQALPYIDKDVLGLVYEEMANDDKLMELRHLIKKRDFKLQDEVYKKLLMEELEWQNLQRTIKDESCDYTNYEAKIMRTLMNGEGDKIGY